MEGHCMQVMDPVCYSLVVRLGGVMEDAAAACGFKASAAS